MPAILDVVRIELGNPCPKSHQPENWTCGVGPGRPWQILRQSSVHEIRVLRRAVWREPLLFGSTASGITLDSLLEAPLDSSLALVRPTRLYWEVKRFTEAESYKCQATFDLSGRRHTSLKVTDPAWKAKMLSRGEGRCGSTDLGVDEHQSEVFLTISVTEPLERDGVTTCWKVVAGVVVAPRELREQSKPTVPAGSSRLDLTWSVDDEDKLVELFRSGATCNDVSRQLGRCNNEVRERLRLLGLI